MYKALLSTAALAAILSTTTAIAHADDLTKDKCFGIATAGKNDCANLTATHGCMGSATTDKDVAEWQYVAKGECATLGGLSKAEAEAKLAANTNTNTKATAATAAIEAKMQTLTDTSALTTTSIAVPTLSTTLGSTVKTPASVYQTKAGVPSNQD
jgi:uncharacterized membrane protein